MSVAGARMCLAPMEPIKILSRWAVRSHQDDPLSLDPGCGCARAAGFWLRAPVEADAARSRLQSPPRVPLRRRRGGQGRLQGGRGRPPGLRGEEREKRKKNFVFNMLQVNGRWVLSGIVSWGLGCGEKDVPGVYVEVRIRLVLRNERKGKLFSFTGWAIPQLDSKPTLNSWFAYCKHSSHCEK